MSLAHKSSKCEGDSGLGIVSAYCRWLGTWDTTSYLWITFSWTKNKSSSICLVLAWRTGLWESAIVLILRQRIVGDAKGKLSSVATIRSNTVQRSPMPYFGIHILCWSETPHTTFYVTKRLDWGQDRYMPICIIICFEERMVSWDRFDAAQWASVG